MIRGERPDRRRTHPRSPALRFGRFSLCLDDRSFGRMVKLPQVSPSNRVRWLGQFPVPSRDAEDFETLEMLVHAFWDRICGDVRLLLRAVENLGPATRPTTWVHAACARGEKARTHGTHLAHALDTSIPLVIHITESLPLH